LSLVNGEQTDVNARAILEKKVIWRKKNWWCFSWKFFFSTDTCQLRQLTWRKRGSCFEGPKRELEKRQLVKMVLYQAKCLYYSGILLQNIDYTN
jgi:hypothetical protein